jgi:hypothetical protein
MRKRYIIEELNDGMGGVKVTDRRFNETYYGRVVGGKARANSPLALSVIIQAVKQYNKEGKIV